MVKIIIQQSKRFPRIPFALAVGVVKMECTFNILPEESKKEIFEMSELKELENRVKYLIVKKE